jgi:hypothetical protein
MRPAVHRQSHPDRGGMIGRQKQAIAAKIVKTKAIAADCVQHRPKATLIEQLFWQQMMALQTRIIVWTGRMVNRSE